MELTFDLENKPLTRALISHAVKSIALETDAGTGAATPKTHFELLQAGVVSIATDITDRALLLQGRSDISSHGALPADAPVIMGFGLLIMLGIRQAVANEGVDLDTNELTEKLIERYLAQRIKAAGSNEAAKQALLEISRTATQIPGQIVETAKGEVEGLFRTCYSLLPGFIQGSDETRGQLLSIFGTALMVLLQSQIKTND